MASVAKNEFEIKKKLEIPTASRTSVIAERNDRVSGWTPRRELISLLPGLRREISCDIRLLFRVIAAIWFGSLRSCNLAVDAVLLHREQKSGA
jgi:hypothetical protein